MLEEKHIWEQIRNGSKQSLQELHNRYFNQMCLYAFKSVKESGVVEELVSDCFIKLWENRKKIKITTSVKHYIFLILRNSIVDYHRKKRYLTESLETVPEPADESFFEEQKKYARLYSIIENMPEQRKKILELAVFDSLTYDQIADKLNISKNTVKTQMGRAYRYLKENLDRKEFMLFYFFANK